MSAGRCGWICWVVLITCTCSVRADPFYCDDDIVPDVAPLPSYAYHCDGINQCIDRRDEAGCTSCPSGKLLLVGVDPLSLVFQYETVFKLQHYRLRNKPVYKTTDDALQQGYVTYNDLRQRWEVSKYADQGILLFSNPTISSQPFLDGVTWRLTETGKNVPSLNFQCVPEDMRKCYGDVMVVSPSGVIKLNQTKDLSHDRVRYQNDKYELQYVLTSDTWPAPHWQVLNKATSEEDIVFLNTTAQYPEFITSPGLYKSSDLSWAKSSNLYVRCAVLTTAPDSQPHPLDCIFKSDTCGWSVRAPGAMELAQGAVERFSVGQRAPPSVHIASDRGTPPGKYRLTSPRFDLKEESCLLVKFANTVTAPEGDATISIVLKDLYSAEEVFELGRCTNPNKQQCSRVDHYPTQLIDLTLGDGSPKTNAQIVITIELRLSEQPSGVVALVETALIAGSCDGVNLKMVDPCYDLDYPCNSDHCVMAGYRGFECQCADSATYGPHCGHSAEKCPVDNIEIAHATEIVPLTGYRGSDLLHVQCQAGFEVSGEIPRCARDGTYGRIPECVPVKCPTVNHSHSTVSVVSPTLTTVQCDKGFLPSTLQSLKCQDGQYTSSLSPCLLQCPAILIRVVTDETENESESNSPAITVDVSLCDYASGAAHSNYTLCKENSYELEVPGSLSVSTDVNLSVDTRGKLCVNLANTTKTGELRCALQCVESSVAQLIRVVDGKQQFVKVLTNFDYSREKLVNSSRDKDSLALTVVLLGFCFLLVS